MSDNPVVPDLAVPSVAGSSSAIDKEGEAVLQRRQLLTRILVTAGLSVAPSVFESATSHASALEEKTDYDEALTNVHRKIYTIGRDHMTDGTPSVEILGKALSAWRDAYAIRNSVSHHARRRARSAEAFAAGLVAQFYGDRGNKYDAYLWYKSATEVAPNVNELAWLYGCSAWIPLYEGNARGAIEQAARAVSTVNWTEPERAAFAHSQLARAHALNGDPVEAAHSFRRAQEHFDSSSYGSHRTSLPNLLHFTQWQFAQYAAETLSMIGRAEEAREFYALASSDVHLNGMNRAVLEINEARLLAYEDSPDGAVEHAMAVISTLAHDDRTSSVVKGKAQQLSNVLSLNFAGARSVEAFKGFTRELVTAV